MNCIGLELPDTSIFLPFTTKIPSYSATFEYIGDDSEADLAKMAVDPKTQEWRKIMIPMQILLEIRAEGGWWAAMPEVFHTD